MKYATLFMAFAASTLLGPTLLSAQDLDPQVVKLFERERQIQEVVKKVAPSIVALTDKSGWGSGVLVSGDGVILTAGHVIMQADRENIPMKVIFADGTESQAVPLGRNMKTDSALLKLVNSDNNGKPWPHVELGSSSDLKRGQWTVSMGHPGGLVKNRPAPVRVGRILSLGGRTIVTDGTIIVGDSGGPMFDLSGRVIGVHSMIGSDITNNRHVAIDVVRRDWARLEDGEAWGTLGDFDTGLVGSSMFGTSLFWRDYEARVDQVEAGSPAEVAGIKPGDRLLKVDGQAIADQLELSLILGERKSGESIAVEVQRNRAVRNLMVKLGPRPARTKDPEFRRSTRAGIHEKAGRYALAEFRPVVKKRNTGVTVRLIDAAENSEQLALGTVVRSNGLVITKYSEVVDAEILMCKLSSGRTVPARILAFERKFDLALLKVEASGLPAVQWQPGDAAVGKLVVSPDVDGEPVAIGVVSVEERKLDETDKPFLGVKYDPNHSRRSGGAQIIELVPGGAAARAGLRVGDVIIQINNRIIAGGDDLTRRISGFRPGDGIRVRIERRTGERSSEIFTREIVLSEQFVPGSWRRGFDDQNMLGPKLSEHATGFPIALQHDTVLQSSECGGPLLNLNGEAVGINIARAGRVMSYAIPADDAQNVINTLISRVGETQ